MEENKQDKFMHAFTDSGIYRGFVRISHDDPGHGLGEIYDTYADRVRKIIVAALVALSLLLSACQPHTHDINIKPTYGSSQSYSIKTRL